MTKNRMDARGEFQDAAAVDELRQRVATLDGGSCSDCARPMCGHEALFSIALGFQTTPRCLSCLAGAMQRPAAELRDHLFAHVSRRECYGAVWREANEDEGFAADAHPGCLWGDEPSVRKDSPPSEGATTGRHDPQRPVAAEWDAGDMGCGDLVLALRIRLNALAPGDLLKLTARDPGAPEDIPAWCRLTGHRLVAQHHPEYVIQRKET